MKTGAKSVDETKAQVAVGSRELLDINRHSENESVAQASTDLRVDVATCRRTISSLEEHVDDSWSLLQLLDMLSCPAAESLPLVRLAQTSQECADLRALASLWQSLGHPTSGFWRVTRVFYNRTEHSYKWMS